MLVIDKKHIDSSLPPLPPYLTPKRRPERRVFILPDICNMQAHSIIHDHTNNWQTIVHQWMNRITGENFLDPQCKIEYAHAHSRRYRQWLETYEIKDGIPPHIQFGGAIKSGKGDPTFYSRWQDWARETFG